MTKTSVFWNIIGVALLIYGNYVLCRIYAPYDLYQRRWNIFVIVFGAVCLSMKFNAVFRLVIMEVQAVVLLLGGCLVLVWYGEDD